MRTAELAALAGVTIRTIRYYHQAGALPEPRRLSNGYRDYDAEHVVAVLRIRQLTASGLSLAHAAEVAADSVSASTEEALDEVDRALEAQIIALTEQRQRLARARSGRHVGLSRLAAAVSLKPTDIPGAVLFAHLYDDHPDVEHLADALWDPELRSALSQFQDRFDAIDDHTSEEELDELAARATEIFAEHQIDLPPPTSEQQHLMLGLIERYLNDRQKEFVRRQE